MTVVSSPTLTRVAGLPADALDIVSPVTRTLLAELADQHRRLAERAEEVVDVLFKLVPLLDDDVPLRRKVLAGKRAVGRQEPLPWDGSVRQRVAARLAPAQAAEVDAWVRLTEDRARLVARLREQLSADRTATVENFRALLETTGLASSLALAAPDWIRYGRQRTDSARSIRTLVSYVARTAVKTSPFSGLTTVGMAGSAGRGRARSCLSAAATYRALEHVARTEETAALLTYRPAQVRPGGPGEPEGLVLQSEVTAVSGIVWRVDRVVEADHARRWLDGLPDRFTLPELLDRLGGDRPFTRFRRLLDCGLVYPVAPWRQGEEPLPVLADLVRDVPGLARELREAHELSAGAHDSGSSARIATVTRLQQLVNGWRGAAGDRSELDTALLYEDRETDLVLPDPCADAAIRQDLEDLGRWTRPYVFRSHLYDVLVERFRAEFGPGGVCRDVLGFLMRLTVDRDSNPAVDAATVADRAIWGREAGSRAWLPVGPTSAPPSASVLFQLGEDPGAAAGEYRMVVNQYNPGSGGVLARFGALLGEDFRSALARHVAQSWDGVRCRELVLWTECNTAQTQCAGVLPPLVVPGEIPADDAMTLDDLVLAHDPGNDTLSLFDADGAPVGLAYLGLIPPHMLQSYVRLLAVLADPWVNGSPYSDYTMMLGLNEHCGVDVVALPRVSHGRVVTRRASWIVPVAAIPRPASGERDEADLMLRLDAFRRANGIPEEVFVHQLAAPTMPVAADRKPMWVSLASPLSFGVLLDWLADETRHVRMVEVLPERHLHPQTDRAGRRRVTEHAALLRWPREV